MFFYVFLFFFLSIIFFFLFFFFFQAEDGIRDLTVTGVQTCALPISAPNCIGTWTSTAARCLKRQPCKSRRSEERRVGKECRSRWSPYHEKKKKRDHGVEPGAHQLRVTEGVDPATVLGQERSLGNHVFVFSSRRRHTRFDCDWSSDVCSSD